MAAVRGDFIKRGTSFRAWCEAAGIDAGYGHRVLSGKANGPAAVALRARIIAASQGSVQ